jgi:hypothetical protein
MRNHDDLVSSDEDETTAKRSFVGESGVKAERKTSGDSVL